MMRKKILITLFFIFLSVLVNLLLPRVARGAPANCVLTVNGESDLRIELADEITFDFDFTPVANDFANTNFLFSFPGTIVGRPQATIQGTHAIYTTGHDDLTKIGTHRVELLHESLAHACNEETYEVYPRECEITIVPANPDFNSDITIQVREMIPLTTKKISLTNSISKERQILPGNTESYDWPIGQLAARGTYTVKVYDAAIAGPTAGLTICTEHFYVGKPGESIPPSPGIPYDLCQGNQKCLDCVGAGNSYTAIGCITTSNPQEFVAWLLARAIGIAGGIAFLLMIFAGFQIITSSGDPEKLKSGKEMLTSAIIGLIVIIFSIFLLTLIGVDILKLPGFGE